MRTFCKSDEQVYSFKKPGGFPLTLINVLCISCPMPHSAKRWSQFALLFITKQNKINRKDAITKNERCSFSPERLPQINYPTCFGLKNSAPHMFSSQSRNHFNNYSQRYFKIFIIFPGRIDSLFLVSKAKTISDHNY